MIPPVVLPETAKAVTKPPWPSQFQLQQIVRRVTELARPVVGLEGLGATAVAAVFPVAPVIVLGHVAAWNVAPFATVALVPVVLIDDVGTQSERRQRIPPAVVVTTIAMTAEL